MKHSGHPVKTFPSGFAVNPSFPFMDVHHITDAKVIDPSESDPFGILEMRNEK